jgi:uncharacterized RDD family membrane protein YckC
MAGSASAESWKRMGAFIIDVTLIYLQAIVIIGFSSACFGIVLPSATAIAPAHMVIALLVFLSVGWLYSAIGESSPKQATLGKMVFGIIVTDLEGGRLSFLGATRRFWVKVLSGFLAAVLIARRQALHNKIAGSLVVNKTKLSAETTAKKAVFA